MGKIKKFSNFINTSLVSDDWFNAIETKDIIQIKQMIDDDFDVNTKDENNDTALHILCYNDEEDNDSFLENDNITIIKLLLENGANVNLIGSDDFSVLGLISSVDNPLTTQVIQLLLDFGANINIQREMATSLVISAYYRIMRNVYILIDNGADWFVIDDENKLFIDHLSDSEKGMIKKKYPEKYEEYIKKKNIRKFKI